MDKQNVIEVETANGGKFDFWLSKGCLFLVVTTIVLCVFALWAGIIKFIVDIFS